MAKKTKEVELNKAVASMEYKGHSIKPNGVIEIELSAGYGQLAEVLKITTMIAEVITVKIKAGNDKPFRAGVMKFKSLSINESGVIKVKLYGRTADSDVVSIGGLIALDKEEEDEMIVCFEQEEATEEGEEV